MTAASKFLHFNNMMDVGHIRLQTQWLS